MCIKDFNCAAILAFVYSVFTEPFTSPVLLQIEITHWAVSVKIYSHVMQLLFSSICVASNIWVTHLVCSFINPHLFPDCRVLSHRMPSAGCVYRLTDTNKQIPNTHSFLLPSALRCCSHSLLPVAVLDCLLFNRWSHEFACSSLLL